MPTFGAILRDLRKCSGLTQTQLADVLGLKFSTISMYERGEREPDFETLEEIADYFNVSMDRLHGKSVGEVGQTSGGLNLSEEEAGYIHKYRLLPDEARVAVRRLIDSYYDSPREKDGKGADYCVNDGSVQLLPVAAMGDGGHYHAVKVSKEKLNMVFEKFKNQNTYFDDFDAFDDFNAEDK